MTEQEIHDKAQQELHDQATNLGLPDNLAAVYASGYMRSVEFLKPNKTEATRATAFAYGYGMAFAACAAEATGMDEGSLDRLWTGGSPDDGVESIEMKVAKYIGD